MRKYIIEALFYITLLIALIPSLFGVMRTIETNFFPVVNNVSFEVTDRKVDLITLKLEFDKVRNCDYLRIQTFVGQRSGRAAGIPNEFNTDIGSRPTGEGVEIGNWQLVTNEPMANVYADVLHRCHPLYVTRTKFIN